MPGKSSPDLSITPDAAPQGIATGRARRLVGLLPMTAFWALLAQGILSVTRLLTTMTVGGKFGSGSEEQLGYYSNGFAALMVMIALFEAFVTTPLTVFNSQQPIKKRPAFAGQMLLAGLMLIGAIFAICGVLFAIQMYWQTLKPELAAALVAVSCMAPFQLLREFSRRWLLANLQVKASAALEFLFAGLFFIGVFSLVASGNVTAVTMFGTLAIVNAVGLVGWWLVFRKQFDFGVDSAGDSRLRERLLQNAKYGRWVAGENVCSTLTMYFSSWFLTYKLDEAAAGVFFACFTIVMLANPFLLGISSILAPRAALGFHENRYSGMFNELFKLGLVLMAVMVLISIGLWLAGDRLTTLLFPSEYAGYFEQHLDGKNRITAVLGLALPAMGLSYITAYGLLAAKRPRDNFIAAVFGVIVLILVNLSFADVTLMTAAVSFVASYYVAMTCRSILLMLAFYHEL